MTEMPIKAIAPWFGGKRNLAGRIIELLGPHSAYWEVFCGSMAVLLAKPPCAMETCVDLHGDLTNLARCLQAEATAVELYGRLSRTLMSDALFETAKASYMARGPRLADETVADVGRAYDYFLMSWVGRNGNSGTAVSNHHYCVRYTSGGGHAAKRFHGAVASIPAWHERLRAITILRRDAFEVLERIEDRAGTVIYADPPYLVKGTKYVQIGRASWRARV